MMCPNCYKDNQIYLISNLTEHSKKHFFMIDDDSCKWICGNCYERFNEG